MTHHYSFSTTDSQQMLTMTFHK